MHTKHRHRRDRVAPPARPVAIQPLESRQMMSASPTVSPNVTILAASSTVTGYTPAQITAGYGLAGLKFGTTSADGAGQTIAIVDAYNDPDIAADLSTFDAQFGLATASLTVVSQTGSTTSLPSTDADWAQEISLDVEWAHAIAPAAKILLVEASSDSTADLMSAVDYARNAAGVSVVSMSWGTSEFSDETTYDSNFTTPSGHTGVTFVAAAGDDGSSSGAEWPAAAAGVVSVGGTTLTLTSSGTYESETGWSDGGGGSSAYEGEAEFQYAVQRTGNRTTPDVAWDASVSTGMAVFDSLAVDGESGWLEFGGTSAGAPQWAALIAIADQGRTIAGSGTLDGATNTLPTLYGLYAHKSLYDVDFNDITSGSTSPFISASTGYDEVSGIGTPKAASLVAALVRATATIPLVQTTVTPTAPINRGPGHPHGGYELSLEVADPVLASLVGAAGSAEAASVAAPATFATGGFGVATFDAELAATAESLHWACPATLAVDDGGAGELVAMSDAGQPAFSAALSHVVAPADSDSAGAGNAYLADAVPLPANWVASGVPPLPASATIIAAEAVPTGTPSHAVGVGTAAAGAAVALWLATEPARTRQRELSERSAHESPLEYRHLIANGLLRG